MSLISGLLGGSGAERAGNAIANAGIAGENGVLNATLNGQTGVDSALTNNQTALSNATQGSTADVANGAAAANSTLGNTLSNIQGNLSPYTQAGAQGASQLAAYAASNPQFNAPTAAEAAATPGEEFIRDQGAQAINNTASASGLANSGNTLKALTQYGQNLGSTYYQQAFNNAQSQFNTNQNATLANLSALTNTGLNANSQLNSAALNVGNAQAANTYNAGQYAGNVLNNNTQFNNTQQLQGNEFNANLGLQGSTQAGQFANTAAQGTAAGILGFNNSLGNIFAGMNLGGL